MGEDGGEHGAQRRQKFADIRRAALEQAHEVDTRGKCAPGRGHDHGARGRYFGKARGQRFAELHAHGVDLAVRKAQHRHAALLGDLDHVACSSCRKTVPPAASPTRARRRSRRAACATAMVSTTMAMAWCNSASARGAWWMSVAIPSAA